MVMRDRRREAREARIRQTQQQEEEAKRRVWHSPSPWAWCMIAAATALLAYLSIWQVNRLTWKTALIDTLAAHQYRRAFAGIPELDDGATLPDDLAFSRFTVSGTFLHDDEAHLAARYYNSQLGYHILTPFRLRDGRVILLNRGWVHVDDKDPATRPQSQPEGEQHITVMLRMDKDRNMFTPDHDIDSNIWFWRDVKGIASARGLTLYPHAFDVLYDIPPGHKPIPSNGLITLRNDHRNYAITWALIGISGMVIFIMYHYRPRQHSTDDTTTETIPI